MKTNLEMIKNALTNGFDLMYISSIDFSSDKFEKTRIASVDYKKSTNKKLNCRFEGWARQVEVDYDFVHIVLKHSN